MARSNVRARSTIRLSAAAKSAWASADRISVSWVMKFSLIQPARLAAMFSIVSSRSAPSRKRRAAATVVSDAGAWAASAGATALD